MCTNASEEPVGSNFRVRDWGSRIETLVPITKLNVVTFPNTVHLILTIVKTSFLFSVQIDHHYLEEIIQVLVHDCD